MQYLKSIPIEVALPYWNHTLHIYYIDVSFTSLGSIFSPENEFDSPKSTVNGTLADIHMFQTEHGIDMYKMSRPPLGSYLSSLLPKAFFPLTLFAWGFFVCFILFCFQVLLGLVLSFNSGILKQ